ncbi:MAG: AMP-binding protein [Clostridia bacterium]|nr:AMP-binding protein [Clostridia bacterium]
MGQLLQTTIGGLLTQMADRYPDNEALVHYNEGTRFTYKEFNDHCNRIARGLLGLGIKKGDHIAIWATNKTEWVILQFASAKIGVVLVTVNTNYKVFELEYLLKQSDSMTLFLIDHFKETDYLGIFEKVCPEIKECEKGHLVSRKLPLLKNVVYIGDEIRDGMYQFNELISLGNDISDEYFQKVCDSCQINDVINMQYTSGTTGFPKGVMLTHYNILNNGKSIGDCMKLTENDRLLIPVPLFHCFGCVLGVLACVTHGTTMILVDYFRPQWVLEAVDKEKCTALHGVPTMFIALLDNEKFNDYDLSHLRTGIMAGSPCPVKVMEQVVDKMGMTEVTIAFGQTEASPVCTQTTTDDSIFHRVSTVGRALPNIECRIVDPETNMELPPDTQGEFVARGYNIMKGYYKMEEATRLAIDNEGWLHTGDLATMDADGYYKITGRIKDMIIRGGENIYPKEIEEFLYTHPKISDVQVIGIPSKEYGEEIMACVITKTNETVTEEEIKTYVKENMSRHKTPKHVVFMDSFPLTASGKIQKYKLRELGIEIFNLQDAANIETA